MCVSMSVSHLPNLPGSGSGLPAWHLHPTSSRVMFLVSFGVVSVSDGACLASAGRWIYSV